MDSAQDHYARLLARHYTWMFGVSFEEKVREQLELLRGLGLERPGIAVDLGCGSGFQSMALAELGAEHVYAFDTSALLLAELRSRVGAHQISTHERDLRCFADSVPGFVDTIVCMGDTLTHLPTKEDVEALVALAVTRLAPGGRLLFSWRDLSSPPQGLDRFISLRSDDTRLMHCFLEDRGATVLVHDIVHDRTPTGWQMHKSAYPKLKISPAWLSALLGAAGLQVTEATGARGMSILLGRSPPAGD